MLNFTDVETADRLLEHFCKSIERIYGHNYCTPNMHLHIHLKDTLLNSGPAHATWCFSFERYDQLVGSASANNKSIKISLYEKIFENSNDSVTSYQH